MLGRAATAAEEAGVSIEWVRVDAARFSLPEKYDGAICLCEGAFGLLGAEDDPIGQPLSILGNVSRSLKPGAKDPPHRPQWRGYDPQGVERGRIGGALRSHDDGLVVGMAATRGDFSRPGSRAGFLA